MPSVISELARLKSQQHFLEHVECSKLVKNNINNDKYVVWSDQKELDQLKANFETFQNEVRQDLEKLEVHLEELKQCLSVEEFLENIQNNEFRTNVTGINERLMSLQQFYLNMFRELKKDYEKINGEIVLLPFAL